MRRITQLPIQVNVVDGDLVFDKILPLARQLKLTAYDAAYVELAHREDIALASLDEGLRHAARTSGLPLLV